MNEHRYILDQKCKDALINRLKTEIFDIQKDAYNPQYSSRGVLNSPESLLKNQIYQEPYFENTTSNQISNLQKLYDELKERYQGLNIDFEQSQSLNKEQALEIISLRDTIKQNQTEIKMLDSELSKIKRHRTDLESNVDLLKFRISNEESVVSESKNILEDYKNEIANTQQKYLDIRKGFENAKYTIDEQALTMDQLRREHNTFNCKIAGRDEEIELLKIKCVALKDESNLIKSKKIDMEKIIDNLVQEINQLRMDDEACRKIQDRRNYMEKLRSNPTNHHHPTSSFGSRTHIPHDLGSTYRSRLDNSYV